MVVYQGIIEYYTVDYRYDVIIRAVCEEYRRRVARHLRVQGIVFPQGAVGIFPYEIEPRIGVGMNFVHRNHRINQDGEIRPRGFVRVQCRGGCRKMSSSGKAHDTDLFHTEFFRMLTAISEYVMHVFKRNSAVAVRQPVFDDRSSDAETVQPLGNIDAFIVG